MEFCRISRFLTASSASFVVLVVFLVLGVDSNSKNATNGTKSVREQNILHKEQKMCANKFIPNRTKNATKGLKIALYSTYCGLTYMAFNGLE